MPAKKTAKKSTIKTSPAKAKAALKKTVQKKTTAKKEDVNQTTKKKSTTKASGSSTKKATIKKSTAKKSVAKKSTEKKSAAKKSAAKSSKPKRISSSKQTAAKKKTAQKTKGNITLKKNVIKTTSTSSKTKTKRVVPIEPRVKAREFPPTKWGSNLEVHFEITEQLPPNHLTSIAGGMVFHDDKVVLANVPGRGWEIIGGRIDLDEHPEETFRREVENQLGIIMSHTKLLGLMRIEHKGPMPPNCPYPYPVAYGIQYIGILKEMLPFESSVDSLGRSLISFEGLPEHYYGWNAYHEAVFKYAFEEYHKLRKKNKL